jgi:esterase/lipase
MNLITEKHYFASRLYEQMIIFIELMKLISESTTSMLKIDFHSKLQTRFFEFIKKNTIKVENYIDQVEKDIGTQHIQIADKLRNSKFYKNLFEIQKFNIENKTLFQKPQWNPFFFEDIYKWIPSTTNKKKPRDLSHCSIFNEKHSTLETHVPLKDIYRIKTISRRKPHIIILVHGYQGCRYDVRVIQNFLGKILPESVSYASRSNEDMEGKSIQDMGRDLAKEVIGLTKIHVGFEKISFVGHSLGGIIVREALTYLKSLRRFFFTYISLSVPHLGCRKNKSILVSLGMKYLKKFKKDLVISQLQLDDAENFEDTFLYQLASKDCLHWFKNLIFVSSPQDSYVPYTSARIQPKKPNGKSKSDKICYKMAEMIWSKVENEIIVRLDADIRSQER